MNKSLKIIGITFSSVFLGVMFLLGARTAKAVDCCGVFNCCKLPDPIDSNKCLQTSAEKPCSGNTNSKCTFSYLKNYCESRGWNPWNNGCTWRTCSSVWQDTELCGPPNCTKGKRLQYQYCTCNPFNYRCRTDASCDPEPTPTPTPCLVTAPADPVANVDATSAVLSWTPGGGGTQQLIRAGTNQTEVQSGCPGGAGPGLGCVVAESLPLEQSGYITEDILLPETTYYWRVVEFDDASCWVDFGGVIGVASSVTFTTPALIYDPWWQVIDSDIIAGGNIISSIPSSCTLPGCNPLFGLEGLGGFPGVPVYGGSSASFGDGEVSSTGWLANSETLFSKIYDYSYFSRLVRPDVTLTEILKNSVNEGFFASGGTPKRGFVWYHFDGENDLTLGDLDISSINMPADRKVVVLVENADLRLNGAIDVNDGIGFIMFIVGKNESGDKGNIIIADSLPGQDNIEGVFLTEGQFRTGAGSNPLYVRGMVAAYDGIVLERDLSDNSDEPAEVFEFAPDFILNFPRDLTFKRLRWKEVAP